MSFTIACLSVEHNCESVGAVLGAVTAHQLDTLNIAGPCGGCVHCGDAQVLLTEKADELELPHHCEADEIGVQPELSADALSADAHEIVGHNILIAELYLIIDAENCSGWDLA